MTPYGVALATALAIAVTLLIAMVPGGSLETRSFDHLPRPVFWGFNVFLVSLGLVTLAAIAAALAGADWAYPVAVVVGVLYVVVFALDLFGVFPRTPDPMGAPLLTLEVVDMAVGAVVVVVAIGGLSLA